MLSALEACRGVGFVKDNGLPNGIAGVVRYCRSVFAASSLLAAIR